MNARDVAFWHVASFRCNAMIRRLSEAKRTLASQPHERPSVPGASLNIGPEARSSFFEIGFRNVSGEGFFLARAQDDGRLLLLCKRGEDGAGPERDRKHSASGT